jgi:acetyl-CoA/propionyl-CoA carboxylase biotin carboxyl carrier protein
VNAAYRVGERVVPVAVAPRAPSGKDGRARFRVTLDGREREVEVVAARDGSLVLDVDGARVTAWTAVDGDERWVAIEREPTVRFGGGGAAAGARAHRGGGDESLRATMHGQVVQVAVAPGDEVVAGQLLVVLEAMKMEILVTAPHDGTVVKVGCAVKDVVERGQVLVELAGTPD